MYKEDIEEWMGDIEDIRVFIDEGDTPTPTILYQKLVVTEKMLSFFKKHAEISKARHFLL